MSLSFPVFETSSLLLRQFEDSDLDNVFLGLSHPDVVKYYGIQYDSREDTKKQLDWFAELGTNETGIWWAICSLDNHVFYGAGGLNDWNKKHHKAEIGFWMLPQHWGKGIIKEAIPIILEYGFDKMRIHRIEAIVETENLNCQRVMDKLDFIHEGTLKECEFKNGRWISLDIYAKLRDI